MTTPQPQGLPPLREIEPAFDHPEHHMKWTRSEIKWIKEYATDYASEALRAMPASRKDIEQAAFEKWLDKERPSGDVEQVQRQWEESSDYEEVQPAALLAEINHWHAIAKKLESELTALAAQAATIEAICKIIECAGPDAAGEIADLLGYPSVEWPSDQAASVDAAALLQEAHGQIHHLIDDLSVCVDDDGLTRYVPRDAVSLTYSNLIGALIPLAERIRAALQASRQPQAQQGGGEVGCIYCDGTGDVHDGVGEWRGICNCPAGDAIRARSSGYADTVPTALATKETK